MNNRSRPDNNSIDSSKIEVRAGTLSGAVKIMSDRVKNPNEEIRIMAILEEEKGLFGMQGAKPATIKVSLKKKTLTNIDPRCTL